MKTIPSPSHYFVHFCFKRKQYIFLLLFFISLSSLRCNKDKEIIHPTISGTVLESGSNKAIEGVTVFLARKDKNIIGGLGYQTLETKTSDASGKFSFDYNPDEKFIYVVAARKAPYFDSEYYYPNSWTNNILTIYLKPPGYLKIHIKNINNSDLIGIGSPCTINCSFYGYQDNIAGIYKILGNTPYQLVWYVYKFNVDTTTHFGTINIPAFDTVLFNINY